MKYETRKFLKAIGIVFLAAAVMMILPRVLVASVMGLIQLAVTVATVWILYRILAPIYHKYRPRSYRPRPRPRRPDGDWPQNRYSDRR